MPRQAPHVCLLHDGRRVPFSLKQRPREPFYFVAFRSPDGRRLEKSTKATNHRHATDSAHQVIKDEYEPRPGYVASVRWDEATELLTKAMAAAGSRQRTVDDYLSTLRVLRRVYPSNMAPADITTSLAKQFKAEYATGHSLWSVKSVLRKLTTIWSKWFCRELEIVGTNPWDDVTAPKPDKLTPRLLTEPEVAAFFTWLSDRWPCWRLPTLFFQVKGLVGCRITELCELRTSQLVGGRIIFGANTTKSRKERRAMLPPALFAELSYLAGPTFVWEKYSVQLRARQTRACAAASVGAYTPARLKRFLQNEISEYLKANPTVAPFSAHDFRRRAMTAAFLAGVSLDRASIAFGCNPTTMRAHYLALDEVDVADDVMAAVQNRLVG